jgi:hypothetical protein
VNSSLAEDPWQVAAEDAWHTLAEDADKSAIMAKVTSSSTLACTQLSDKLAPLCTSRFTDTDMHCSQCMARAVGS